jgi:hypothetical protein
MSATTPGAKLARLVAGSRCHNLQIFINTYRNQPRVPGICLSQGCDNIQTVDATEDTAHCTNCQRHTVMSGLRLAGVV